MSQQNKSSYPAMCDTDDNEWTNSTNSMNFQKQLEKWNQVRQSIYSLNGWCSDNVNQISKWDVGDLEKGNFHEDSLETGTNIWKLKPCPIVPDSACISPQLNEWKTNGAIPKIFNLEDLNRLMVNATNLEFPYSPSHPHQINTDIFRECDTIKPKETDANPALLEMETLNLNTDFPDEMKLTLGT